MCRNVPVSAAGNRQILPVRPSAGVGGSTWTDRERIAQSPNLECFERIDRNWRAVRGKRGARVAKGRDIRRGADSAFGKRMPYGMYISAAGAHVQSERLRVLSNNLANADTSGFKRELAILQAQHAEAIQRGEAESGSGSINDVGGGVRFAETVTDFRPGAVRATGVDTDLAIEGDGFFLVDRDGQQLLTRAGNFHFSSDGRLLTDQGYSVLSADGQPLGIDPRLPWSLSDSGALEQAGTKNYLALVKPRSLGDLVKAGSNLFSPLAPVVPVPLAERRVLPGMLEKSGVVPYLEMMEIIETSRAFESNVRMIQSHDQVLGSLVNRVLRPA